jgi:CheY-like chemotaxis protein
MPTRDSGRSWPCVGQVAGHDIHARSNAGNQPAQKATSYALSATCNSRFAVIFKLEEVSQIPGHVRLRTNARPTAEATGSLIPDQQSSPRCALLKLRSHAKINKEQLACETVIWQKTTGVPMVQNEVEIFPLPLVRVLVVEDEMLIRLLISDALRDNGGVEVIEAATADEAWEYLATENGYVDLVFTDHRMPGILTGAQLASRVRDNFPAMQVVVTSGFYDGTEWAEPILKKPYEVDRTVTTLLEMARQGRGTQR